MKTYTTAELKDILNKHALWLKHEPSGVRAELSCADLSGTNLRGADLSYANLSGAILRDADLRGADLRDADLFYAILRDADLRGADLSGTNLRGADLRGADLSYANLSGSKNLNCPIACPEEGSFIAFKKAYNAICNRCYIIKLEIPNDALRCSATSRKCRCSKAKVISITNIDGTEASVDVAYSGYDREFEYRVGEIVNVDNFGTDRWNECAPGIHFFITRKEAVDY